MSWTPEQVEALEAENESLKTQVVIYQQLMDDFVRMYGLCRSTYTDVKPANTKKSDSSGSTIPSPS